MAILRKKRKKAVFNRDSFEDRSRNSQARNANSPRFQENWISQVSRKIIEGRVTNKLSQKISRTESRILGSFRNYMIIVETQRNRLHSGPVPEKFPKSNRKKTGDKWVPLPEWSWPSSGCLIEPTFTEIRPKRALSHGDGSSNRDSLLLRCDRSSERISILLCWNLFMQAKEGSGHMSVTIPQWQHFSSTEARQTLLALQQSASNSNSTNFNHNINRISNLPKSLTATIPTFDETSEKNEMIWHLFYTSLRLHNQLTEDYKIRYFHSFMSVFVPHTFKNISSPTQEFLRIILAVFRTQYVKPQSEAKAKEKHEFQKVVFNPINQKLVDFPEEIQWLAKDAIEIAVLAFIEQIIYSKVPPHLKKLINWAQVEIGTYEQIFTHLEP